jgi:hypothetical protein
MKDNRRNFPPNVFEVKTIQQAAPKQPSRNLAVKLINTGLPLPKLTMPLATGT